MEEKQIKKEIEQEKTVKKEENQYRRDKQKRKATIKIEEENLRKNYM